MIALMVTGCGVEKVDNKVITIQPSDTVSEFEPIKGSVTGSYSGEIKGEKPHGNGVFKFHVPNSPELTYTGGFKNGKFDGKFVLINKTNESRCEGVYEEGLLQGKYSTYIYGKLRMEIEYKDGKLNGKMKMYYDNGRLHSDTEVKDGKPHGKMKMYYPDGRLQADMDFKGYKDGKPYGKMKLYYDNGQLKFDGESFPDHEEGTLYNRDGSIRKKGKFNAGEISL